MAKPKVLVQEFGANNCSFFVPEGAIWAYSDLERVAFDVLEKDTNQYTVHFHVQDGLCDGRVSRQLWDQGAYLADGVVVGETLKFYAHFQSNGTTDENTVPSAEDSSDAPPSGTSCLAPRRSDQASALSVHQHPTTSRAPSSGSSSGSSWVPPHSRQPQMTTNQTQLNGRFVPTIAYVDGVRRIHCPRGCDRPDGIRGSFLNFERHMGSRHPNTAYTTPRKSSIRRRRRR